jgi:hypothetical protein
MACYNFLYRSFLYRSLDNLANELAYDSPDLTTVSFSHSGLSKQIFSMKALVKSCVIAHNVPKRASLYLL